MTPVDVPRLTQHIVWRGERHAVLLTPSGFVVVGDDGEAADPRVFHQRFKARDLAEQLDSAAFSTKEVGRG